MSQIKPEPTTETSVLEQPELRSLKVEHPKNALYKFPNKFCSPVQCPPSFSVVINSREVAWNLFDIFLRMEFMGKFYVHTQIGL